jgi:hypothetical protein
VENSPVPAEQPEHRVRRKRRSKSSRDEFKEIKSGRLSVLAQIGIILGAFGLAFLLLHGFLTLLSQPPPKVPVDQNIIDSQ